MTSRSPRDRMVRSAALLFRERGVGGTGMRDVVEHAEAPRGSLQHYFPGGKEQLLVEATAQMAWMAERAARPLRAALAAPVPPSPREVVDGLLDRFREVMTLIGRPPDVRTTVLASHRVDGWVPSVAHRGGDDVRIAFMAAGILLVERLHVDLCRLRSAALCR